MTDLTEGGRITIIGGEDLNPGLKMFYAYNAKDVVVTREIRDVQQKELTDFGVMKVFEHEMKLQPICMRMTQTGIRVNLDRMASLRTEAETEIERLQAFLDGVAGRHINVKSPDVKKLLFEDLGLPVGKRSAKTNNPVADKYAIAALAEKHPHPALMAILDIRARRDRIERYLNVRLDPDNRWRALFDPTGTRTGRLASRSNVRGTGNSIQNIPDWIRRMFEADPGKLLWSLDLSQAEARVVAYLARCQALIDLFDSGRDVHAVNALRFFNLDCPEDEVEVKYFGLRYAAKRIIHGSNYGMLPPRLVQSANDDARRTGNPNRLNLSIALKGQSMYFMLYPEIKNVFWREVQEELRRDRLLITPTGRKRQFYGRWDEKLLNEGYSYKPQGAVGDVTCAAMIDLWEPDKQQWKLPDGTDVLINGHDSLVGQAWEKDIPDVIAAVDKAMRIPLEIHGRTLIIPTGTEVGKNWGKYDKEVNPEGMKKVKS
jgi:DNA polymerase I